MKAIGAGRWDMIHEELETESKRKSYTKLVGDCRGQPGLCCTSSPLKLWEWQLLRLGCINCHSGSGLLDAGVP